MNDEWFSITDLNDFVDKVRTIVYSKFGNWENDVEYNDILSDLYPKDIEDMDTILSHSESLNIVKPLLKTRIHKKTKKIRYILDENIFANIIQDLNSRMVSNILNSLVKKGLVESSYDTEANDFVFWIKDNGENK